MEIIDPDGNNNTGPTTLTTWIWVATSICINLILINGTWSDLKGSCRL
jgi:hypothetical protein